MEQVTETELHERERKQASTLKGGMPLGAMPASRSDYTTGPFSGAIHGVKIAIHPPRSSMPTTFFAVLVAVALGLGCCPSCSTTAFGAAQVRQGSRPEVPRGIVSPSPSLNLECEVFIIIRPAKDHHSLVIRLILSLGLFLVCFRREQGSSVSFLSTETANQIPTASYFVVFFRKGSDARCSTYIYQRINILIYYISTHHITSYHQP